MHHYYIGRTNDNLTPPETQKQSFFNIKICKIFIKILIHGGTGIKVMNDLVICF